MKDILYKLFDYNYLTRDEAKQVLIDIVKGGVPETQIASLITSFLMRSISVDEILGFRDALLEMRVMVDLSDYSPLDIVGTGGDGKNTFNISTTACFVVAGAGYNVVKHGNYGATSISGASNVIEQQGVKFHADNDLFRKSLDKCNIAYLHAPLFSPALKAVAPVRKSLGVRNFFNVLGPLVNPVQPEFQMLGVYDLAMLRLYSYIYQEENKKFTIVHSMDGYDEISLTSQFKVVSNRGEQLFMPDDLGFKRLNQEDLYGGDTPEDASKIFRDVLSASATEAQTNAVLVNAAFGIQTVDQTKTIEECIEIARDSLYGKKALKVLEKFIEINS
ncbi:MAG TPA: anthranilate phosphoribosyltransferase [Fermentimonas caenicola]|jgi:anthranilate phosphoribosyltransferase|uniref:Anthranilate phosphoribosyltransferase n=1 Tax=Fermentimonas caenicola TaxID=1562970 RepID=A0A098C1V2_9BACT|nr:anthranilate phosphoribosyltransferase [Lascolabacillus sp.]MBP6175730.1 anthranilate phosphoribosyltransferase [Fermentimonas sp.]MDI9625564.1 anthranilate phosphoribosyltransferase [Bacteroidota bacterium]TAH62361.1 MAG: anthranilate phosphoribosyltransferase [Fermentimonas caenicola]MBP6196997.1 anthranilate phosphoribosyltransferase [Fermentimonas sp.]MBP7104792.1 anthranilate phosphoribosyltransferase [Fermentimonas sp.]